MSTTDQNRVISQNGKDLTQQSIPKIIQAKYRTQNRPTVSRDLNLPIRFGDFKTVYTRDREEKRQKEEKRQGAGQLSQSLSQTGQSDDTPVPSQPGSSPGNTIKPSKDPDYAATNEDHRVRVVGEIKTPWTQDLEAVRPDDIKWRRWMGQISKYMKLYNLKYGFWTTYEQTVFLKQEQNPQGKWFLRVSNVIKYSTKSNLNRKVDDDLTDCVSLRECMLFLICQTKGPDSEVYVHNDDEGFVDIYDPSKHSKAAKEALKKTSQRLGKPTREEVEAERKAELESKSRSRDERAARLENRTRARGGPLDTLRETSRDAPMARLFSPPASRDPRELRQDSSSRSSSASSKQRTHQIRREEESESRSPSSERGRTDTRGPSKAGQGEASRARSTSKKAVPSAEVRGKQKAAAISSSQERRPPLQPLRPGPQGEVLRARSTSARRRGPQYSQQAEDYDDDDDDEDDLYEDPVIERQGPQGPSSTIPIRHSRDAPPPVPQVPQGQGHGLPPARSTQATSRASSPPRRSARRREGQRSPLKALFGIGFSKKDSKDGDDKKHKKP